MSTDWPKVKFDDETVNRKLARKLGWRKIV